MKFYIFGEDRSELNEVDSFTSSAVLTADNYFEVKAYFDYINKEFRYEHTFLVADLNMLDLCSNEGDSANDIIIADISVDNIVHKDYIPFLVVSDFHWVNVNQYTTDSKFDPKKTIRKDSIYIRQNGFTQKFNNNEAALLSYLDLMLNDIDADMGILFKMDRGNREAYLDKMVANTFATKKFVDHASFDQINMPIDLPFNNSVPFEARMPQLFNLKKEENSFTSKIGEDSTEVKELLPAMV